MMNGMTLLLLETDEGRKALLERLIETMGLGNLLGVVADICHEKGRDLDDRWDDVTAAGHWTGAAREIEELAELRDYPFVIR